MTDAVRARLSRWLGPDVSFGVSAVADASDLHPEEAVAIANAIPRRRAEFAAGRRAARQALAALGHADADLPVGSDRAPVWPKGTTGSITHDGGLAVAAAAESRHVHSMGIDKTEAAPLPDGVREQVLRHEEEAGLDELDARAAFSAKETIFKALSPRVGQVFGFSAAIVRPDFADGTFEARLVLPLGPFAEGSSWRGALVQHEGWLMTGLVLPA